MTQVVYADILIIVNTYVNYALLRLTALICRKNVTAYRLALAAFISSFYSFIILADCVFEILIALLKIVFAVLTIFIAFKIKNKKDFFRLLIAFFIVNFAFAGIMLALWLFLAPKGMVFNNGVVYFEIDTLTLVVLTIICYLAIKLGAKYISFKAPKNTIYEIEFSCFGHNFKERAFLDTGNSLKEPFSSLPVIIAYCEIKSTENRQITLLSVMAKHEEKLRFISCTSVGGQSLLKAFRPDFLHIKGIEADFETKDVYIAVCNNKIHGGDVNVLLNTGLFENNTTETEKDYV